MATSITICLPMSAAIVIAKLRIRKTPTSQKNPDAATDRLTVINIANIHMTSRETITQTLKHLETVSFPQGDGSLVKQHKSHS